MKQTVEEASCIHWSESTYKEDAELAYDKHECIAVTALARHISLRAFKAGADWQTKQSPWISVEERLPEENQEYLVVLDNRVICVARYNKNNKSWLIYGNGYSYCVVAYMRIPSFDQILEANKDVLQRMKEKGD